MQLVVVGGLTLTSIYLRFSIDYRKKKIVKKHWSELMEELRLYSKKSNYIPLVKDVKFLDNGYLLSVHVPSGISPSDIERHKEAIENKFEGIATIEKVRFSSTVNIKIINTDIGKYEFKPVETKPNEIYVGKTFDDKDYLIDITKASHLLIGGATGTGKSFLLSSILTNLIYNSSNDIELHLLQIMKGEVSLFERCKPVRFVGKNLREVAYDLEKLAKLVNNRSKKFSELGVKNLDHYNKHYKNGKKKRIYCVTEELSFFMPQDADKEEDKVLKSKCWSAILTIAKAGRSSGTHLLSVTQRSTTTNLPSDVKSQLCRISFKQISSIDSRNIIECDDATELKERECLVYGDSRVMEIIKTPWVDEDFEILNKYVPEIAIPGKGIIKEIEYEPIPEPIEVVEIIKDPIENDSIEETKVIELDEIKEFRKLKKGMIEDD